MLESSWKMVFASLIGTSHIETNVPSQDSFLCNVLTEKNGSEVLVAVASDGAGSASNSKEGSELTCSLFMSEIKDFLESGSELQFLTKEFGQQWIEYLHNALIPRSQSNDKGIKEFSCTLLAAIVGVECAIFYQIGDGAIVYATVDEPEEYCLVEWPQQGEYANTTNFITDNEAGGNLKYEMVSTRIDDIAIFTDGLQTVALDYKERVAYPPFFNSMLSPLRSEKISSNLNEELINFLSSPKINERTNDDKTLILASRRQPSTASVTGNT